jgi:hypothetical protein
VANRAATVAGGALVRKRVRLKVGLAVFIALAGTVGYGLLLDAFPRNEVMRLM